MTNDDDSDEAGGCLKLGLESADTTFSLCPPERHKTILAMMLMFCCACFNGAVAALITDLVPRTPMPDVVFRVVPEQPWAWQVSDTITMLMSLVHIAFVLLHKHRWIVARRFCTIAAQLYLLRGVCMGVTWMAVPGQYHASRCVQPAPAEDYWVTVASRVSRFMLSLGLSAGGASGSGNEQEILCGDLLYSGHTLILVLTWLSIDTYSPRCLRPLRLGAAFAAAMGMTAIVLCRMHYTVDVLLAFVLTVLHYAAYHAHLRLQHLNDRQWRRYARLAFWLLPVVDYFEANVPPRRAPRRMEWPLRRPLYAVRLLKQLN